MLHDQNTSFHAVFNPLPQPPPGRGEVGLIGWEAAIAGEDYRFAIQSPTLTR
ncbi:MAG TPA: hypothetical protein PLV41_11190 [Miltoncostaeales bacterium]|nr:hypothetical protein [Miltoncostaeales bacterium]